VNVATTLAVTMLLPMVILSGTVAVVAIKGMRLDREGQTFVLALIERLTDLAQALSFRRPPR